MKMINKNTEKRYKDAALSFFEYHGFHSIIAA